MRASNIILVCAAGLLGTLSGQKTDATASFEVASVKRSGNQGLGFIPSPGMITVRSYTLKELIAVAHRVKNYQVVGGPNWVGADKFDIVGKAGKRATTLEMLPMLQSLLAQRFGLRFHRETHQIRGYWLVVAKRGAKLKAPDAGDTTHSGMNVSPGHMTGYKLSMEQFATALGGLLNLPIADRTGLQGVFNLALDWAPDEFRTPAASADVPPSESPSVFTALREQLGLKLEAHAVPVEVIVIDHAEMPSEN
jgi:uncharacterized protein (TIGR03435 family)